MDQKEWHQIEKIIDQALEYERKDQQIKFIEQASKNTPELHQKLLILIDAIHQADINEFLKLD